MPLTKPSGIESDAFKSAKWDELTEGRDFAPSDAHALSLLCQWYNSAQQAMDELGNFGFRDFCQSDKNAPLEIYEMLSERERFTCDDIESSVDGGVGLLLECSSLPTS